jgi:muramoyltetrapeptide carboxypeptidase LdcA involved in peptidoglycan recycling
MTRAAAGRVLPPRLFEGAGVRVVAPSRSLGISSQEVVEVACRRIRDLGLALSFGRHVREMDEGSSTTVVHRLEDLHDAWRDPSVHALLTAIGGFNSNQLLRGLDYDLVRHHPKGLCGYSDITALQNAVYAKTGVVTYYGPHFLSFGDIRGAEYTVAQFQRALFDSSPMRVSPSPTWSEDPWWRGQKRRHFPRNPGPWTLQKGVAKGTILGGNLSTFNLLQGTEFMPGLDGAILFVEDEDEDGTPANFDRNLQSLLHQPGADGIAGLAIGRFPSRSGMTRERLGKIIATKPELKGVPVAAGLDFGHTTPMFTFPIGGVARMASDRKSVALEILEH